MAQKTRRELLQGYSDLLAELLNKDDLLADVCAMTHARQDQQAVLDRISEWCGDHPELAVGIVQALVWSMALRTDPLVPD